MVENQLEKRNFRMQKNRKEILKRTKKFWKKRHAKKKKKQRKVYEGLPTITQGKRETRVRKKKRVKKIQQTTLMRNHWSSIWSFLHFLEVWNELKVACLKTEPKNELLLNHCLRTLSQQHQESPNCSQHGQIFTYLTQK